jgi:hypothetical protein
MYRSCVASECVVVIILWYERDDEKEVEINLESSLSPIAVFLFPARVRKTHKGRGNDDECSAVVDI